MSFDHLEVLIAFVLAGSLCMERIVAIVKTFFPQTFGEPGPAPENIYKEEAYDERKAAGPAKDDKPAPTGRAKPVDPMGKSILQVYAKFEARRIYVLMMVLAISLFIGWQVSGTDTTHPAWVMFGPNQGIHFVIYALLISGGSAFWSQCLGVISAVKDLKAKQRTEH